MGSRFGFGELIIPVMRCTYRSVILAEEISITIVSYLHLMVRSLRTAIQSGSTTSSGKSSSGQGITFGIFEMETRGLGNTPDDRVKIDGENVA